MIMGTELGMTLKEVIASHFMVLWQNMTFTDIILPAAL